MSTARRYTQRRGTYRVRFFSLLGKQQQRARASLHKWYLYITAATAAVVRLGPDAIQFCRDCRRRTYRKPYNI